MVKRIGQAGGTGFVGATTATGETHPDEALHRPSGLRPFWLRPFGIQLPSLGKATTTGLILLSLATAANPAARAATIGASHLAMNGAPIEMFVAEIGPATARFEQARETMRAYGDALDRAREARFAVEREERELPYFEKDLAASRAALESWTAPDTTGLPSWEAELAIEDAERERVKHEGDVARFEEQIAATEARLVRRSAELEAAEEAVLALRAMLTPIGRAAEEDLLSRGLRVPVPAAPGGASYVGLAAIIERWEAKTGRAFASLDRHEQAWLVSLGGASPGHVDDLLARIDAVPAELVAQVVPFAAASKTSPEGIERARVVASRLAYTPNTIDIATIERLDDGALERMLARLERLEAIGFAWTGDLRASRFDGPSADTDFTVLTPLATDGDPRFWIDHPASMGPRSVTLSFDALIAAAGRWVEGGRPLTADALPLVAVLGAGGEPALRSNALLARVVVDDHPVALTSIVNLSTGRFAERGLDAEAIAFLDGAIEKLGRKLEVGEAAALLTRHFEGVPLDALLPDAAVARAQALDPRASLDDLYIASRVSGSVDREALEAKLERRIEMGVERGDRAAEYSERFADHVERLSTSDLLRIDWILDALERGDVRRAIADHIEEDLAHERSELGGKMVDVDGRHAFVPLSSGAGSDNNSFVFPEDEDRYAAVVTVHLHATRDTDNDRFAGPSSAFGARYGDRSFAREAHRSDLVIVHLGDGRFGADYYTPEGAVVDLGVFTAP